MLILLKISNFQIRRKKNLDVWILGCSMDSDNSEVEIPSYFLCPISMQLIRDPVTICTGVTYDRESIEQWLYKCNKKTCPATMQILHNNDLTPNHTLRRLIQDWCVANSSKGVVCVPTPRTPLDAAQLSTLLSEIELPPPFQLKGLKKLRSLAAESETNRRLIAASAAPDALLSLIEAQTLDNDQSGFYESAVACEEALAVLYSIPLPDKTMDALATAGCLGSVAAILKRGTSSGRFHGAMLLNIVARNGLQRLLTNSNDDLVEGLLELVTEEVSNQATLATLEVLTAMSSGSRRCRLKAIEAGAVSVLVESLPHHSQGRRISERTLCLIDVLCGCAEGRAAFADHGMGIAAVSKKIMRVSEFATEKAVRILWSICKSSPSCHVLKEMLEIGAVTKLCMLLHAECTAKTKIKAKEMLKSQAKWWRNSPCLPSVMYPTILK